MTVPIRPRNPGIDVLRGLSIVLVVLHHVGLRIHLKESVLADYLPKWSLNALIYNGSEAVFGFFVISGFLIANHTIERWGSLARVDVKAFYVRRASRILPCLTVLVAVLALLHGLGVEHYVIERSSQSLGGATLAAFGLYLNWYEGLTGYLPAAWDVLWSLSIEEAFYVGFPIFCLTVRHPGWLAGLLAIAALSLPVTRAALEGNAIWQEKAYLPGMAAIATGILAALAARRFPPTAPWQVRALAVVGAVAALAALCFQKFLWPYLGNGSLLILTFGTACLLVAADGHQRTGRPWRIRGTDWVQSCGRLSYEIYLTHIFVMWPIVDAFKAFGANYRWGFVWYVPTLILSWGLGWLVARSLSAPAERAIRRWFSTPKPVALSSASASD